MSFSFNTTAGASQSTAKPRLLGNEICTVKFDGCEIQDIKGVKDINALYQVLKLKFSNDRGTYEHTIFEPREEDFNRTEREYTTKTGTIEKIPQTSGVENMMLLFKHAIDSINPTIAKAIDEGTQNLGAKDWNSLRKLVSQILDAGKGASLQIKLLRNNKGEATFPGYFASITKEGKAYIRNNFIGKNLSFTAYEAQRIQKELAATPTAAKTYSESTNFDNLPKAPSVDVDLTFDMPIL